MKNPLTSTVVTIKFAALWFLLAAVLLPSLATAGSLTWDSGKGAGGSDGDGSWVTGVATASYWFNGASATTWDNVSDAVIGSGGTPGSISVKSAVTVGNITFNSVGSGAYDVSGACVMTFTGGTVTVNTGAGSVLMKSVQIGGAVGFTKAGTGTLIFTGIGTPTFTGGPLHVAAGTLQLTSSDWNYGAEGLQVDSGATFDISGQNATVDALTGTGTGYVNNSHASSRALIIGSSGGSGEFDGVIESTGAPADLSLTKTGSGTETLGGTSTYTGTTTVSAGTLLNNGTLATLLVSVSANATFGGTGTCSSNVTYANSALGKFTITPSGGANTTPMTVTHTLACGSSLVVHLNAPAALGNGTYTLVSAGAVSGSVTATATFDTGSLGTGGTGTVSLSGNNLIYTVTGVTSSTKLGLTYPGEGWTSGTGKTGSPSAETAGTAFNITLYALLADGVTVDSTYSGTKTIGLTGPNNSPGGSTPTLPTSATFSSGQATVSVTLVKAETVTITPSLTGLTALTPSSVTVGPATDSAYRITGTGSITAGNNDQLTLNIVDQYQNASTYTGNKTITFSGPGVSPNSSAPTITDNGGNPVNIGTAESITFSSGAASTSGGELILVAKKKESPTLSCSSSGISSGNTGGATLGLTVSANTATALTVESAADGSGSVIGAGNISSGGTKVAYSILRDTYGNFTSNPSVAWTVANVTGGPVNGDLSASSGTTTTYTANHSGSCTIHADYNSGALTADSGLLTTISAIDHYSVVATSPETAGSVFTVVVTAQDSGNNTVNDSSTSVTLTSNGSLLVDADHNGTYGDTSGTLSSGVFTFNVKDNKAETITITATDTGAKTGQQTGVLINAGSATKMMVTLPAQTFTSGSGNSGSVTAQTAGQSFNIVQLTAVDAYTNVDTTYGGSKTISYSGPGGSASSYTTSVSFTSGVSTTTLATTLTKAETTTITASDGSLTGVASSSLTVNAGTATQLQLLLPGQTAVPGSATGVTGTPNNEGKNVAFNVTVNAVDANWNVVSSTHSILLTSTATAPTLPGATPLAGGTETVSVTLTTAETGKTITATDQDGSPLSPATSPSFNIYATWYRSAATGTWSDNTKWQVSTDSGVTWTTAVNSPTAANSDSIEVQNSHTMTVSSTLAVDDMVIDAGGEVDVSGVTMTINHDANGPVTGDLDVSGTLKVTTTASSAVAESGSPTVTFESGSTFSLGIAGGAVPTATWNAASTCTYAPTAASSTIPTGLGQTFGNFVWNWSAQSGSANLADTLAPAPTYSIQGNFEVTGSTVDFTSSGDNTVYALTVGGAIKVHSGKLLVVGGTPGASAAYTFKLGGGIICDSGTTLDWGNPHTRPAEITVDFTGTSSYNVTGATVNNTTNVATYEVMSGAVLTLSSSIAAASAPGAFIVDSGGTLNCGTSAVNGSTFTLSSGGTLGIGSTAGVNGNITATTKNLSTGGNYTFNGAANQAAGALLPSTVNNLTIVNTGTGGNNTVTLNGAMTINGQLNLTSGNISIPVTRSGVTTTVLTLANAPVYANGLTVTSGSTFNDGDVVQLFSLAGSGSFSSVTLPSLATGLEWSNTLGTDGKITVGCDGTLAVTVAGQTDVTCNGGSDGTIVMNTATGGSGSGYTYSDGGAYQSSPTFSGLTATTYTMTAKDSAGCVSAGVPVTINQPDAVTVTEATGSHVDVTCNGGSDGTIVMNTATGGSGSGYQYSKNGSTYQSSPTFSGLVSGNYTIYAKDSLGCVSAGVPVTINQPTTLTAGTANYTHGAGTPLRIHVSDLLALAGGSDASGATLESVSTSANGYTQTITGNYIYYTNTDLAADSFTYTIQNITAGTCAIGMVTVNAVATAGQQGHMGLVVFNSETGKYEATMTFYGILGTQYHVQRSTDMVTPITWTTLDAVTADPTTGQINYTDADAPSSGAFYRLIYP